ncbi:MAG: large subunit ribosome methyltransferase, RlmH/YbeA-like protein [Bacteroidota bacterium]|nr:large subunit ribosome methyltransferase, RlmH/YbeA-like protein [Bacteroidota bacterium]
MKITLLLIGKTSKAEIKAVCDDYRKRINHYVKMEEVIIESAAKNADPRKVAEKEGELILKKLSNSDYVILLDDKGRELTSLQFGAYIEGLFNQSLKHIVFIIGGAYGFSEAVYKRANAKLSLSKMTFSHQVIRVIFSEQLYRAFTIIHKEPYHHE